MNNVSLEINKKQINMFSFISEKNIGNFIVLKGTFLLFLFILRYITK